MDIAGLVLGYIAVIGGLSFSVVPIMYHYRTEGRKRELEHIERMKALEFGRTLPQDEAWWSPSRIAALIGGVVPVGVFLSVGIASSAVGYHEMMWFAAAMVGMSSVISGAVVAAQSHRQKSTDHGSDLKPFVEEDAYDVASARA